MATPASIREQRKRKEKQDDELKARRPDNFTAGSRNRFQKNMVQAELDQQKRDGQGGPH